MQSKLGDLCWEQEVLREAHRPERRLAERRTRS
jgi:hypothetical protein